MAAAPGEVRAMMADPTGPTVSVIIPIGRVDNLLEAQLGALRAQTFKGGWEVVLVLNRPSAEGAVEGALAAIAGVPTVVVDATKIRGAAHARNVGASRARGEMLAFCDADDEVSEGWLEAIVAGLAHNDAVGGHLDEDLLAVRGQEHWRPRATPGRLPAFLGQPYIVSANMGIRREVFESVGGFDEALTRGEDIAISWQLLRRGLSVGYVPTAIVHYRHRPGLRSMLQQHFMYGRGLSQLLARSGMPHGPRWSTLARANREPVVHRGGVYYLRRSSLAAGRLVGLLEELPSLLRSRDRQPLA